ncbi:hypothetical protein D3C84_919310 [compost metagenome]
MRPIIHHPGLGADAFNEQRVVVAEKLNQFARRLGKASQKVPGKAQALGIAYITHRHRSRFAQLNADRLDLPSGAVITNDDFQIRVVLGNRAG